MIIRLFKNNLTSSVLFVPLFAIVLWIFGFLHPVAVVTKNTMPLFELFCRATGKYPLLHTIIAMFLVIIEAFYISNIIEKHNILLKKSNFPALVYVVLMSSCKLFLTLHPMLVANLFVLMSVDKILSSYHKDEAFSQVFDAGFCIGIASLFYFPAIVLFPVVWVGLIVIRTFVWREWIISFIGLIIPYLFVLAFYFWWDKLDFFLLDKIFYPSSDAKYSISNEPLSFIILSVVLVGIIALSFLKLLNGLPVNTILSRNVLIVFIWMMALSGIAFFMAPVLNLRYFSFMAIPLTIYVSNYFLTTKKNWWAELLFLSLVIVIICNDLLYVVK